MVLPLIVLPVSVVVAVVGFHAAVSPAPGGVAADRAVDHRWPCRSAINRPPTPAAAWLPLTLLSVSVVVACSSATPPPMEPELPLTVQSVRVWVCGHKRGPDAAAVVGGVAADGAVGLRGQAASLV